MRELAERLTRLVAEDPDTQVRLAAAEAFGLMHLWSGFEKAWAAPMVTVLGRVAGADPDPRVCRSATHTLAQLWGVDQHLVIEALRPHIEHHDVYVAAWALARVAGSGDPHALDRLWTVVAAPDVHREYLSAATSMFAFYRGARSEHRRRLRKALIRLRKQGWANAPTDEPGWSPQARGEYLKTLISSLSHGGFRGPDGSPLQ